MKKNRQHIHQIISIVLLWVFAVALIPFGALHHHEEEVQCVKHQKTCSHKLHVSNHTDNCLICAAHFEKNYLHQYTHFQVFLEMRTISKDYATASGSYTELIGSSLRGPPVV
ncbi:hypothetical protein [Pedobacter steynii]|uniref:Uncharacterized protein n=1 Tax=Pedobacter steynii TaxID=430522 RepID=A0A1D7QG41_9SPHI|nr:hypothetical protein [Pedobacter steynii]AOM77617.1 hypothetical protein BFS30_10830 [Pedobacter steynii]